MINRLPSRLAVSFIAAALFASPAAAQEQSPVRDAEIPAVTAPASVASQPEATEPASQRQAAMTDAVGFDNLRAGVRAPVERDAVQTPAVITARQGGFTHAQVLMIVGGAALLTGALIGDDAGTLIMIGGAGIGLWGLYLFLQ